MLVPRTKNIVIVADRAFGTAVFTDLVQERGWHYIVRVQDQTRCQDDFGHELPVRHLVRAQHQRAKRSCWRVPFCRCLGVVLCISVRSRDG